MAARLAELSQEGVSLGPIGEVWVDYLDPAADGRAYKHKEFPFSGGKDGQYVVMALCDEFCSDIDLLLYPRGGVDAQAKPLQADTETDAEPLLLPGLLGPPLEDGDYDVEVRMYSCEEVYCYFAVGLYGFQDLEVEGQ